MIPNMSKIDFFWSRPKDFSINSKFGLRPDSFKIVYFGAMGLANGMDFIISWNCKHLCNIQKKRKYNAVNLMMGYREIDIVTPLEVIGDE
jgi:hypothetical protein